MRVRRGFAPDPTGGRSSRRSADPRSRLGGTPSPDLAPLGAFGVSTVAPPALGFAPLHTIFGYTLYCGHTKL